MIAKLIAEDVGTRPLRRSTILLSLIVTAVLALSVFSHRGFPSVEGDDWALLSEDGGITVKTWELSWNPTAPRVQNEPISEAPPASPGADEGCEQRAGEFARVMTPEIFHPARVERPNAVA